MPAPHGRNHETGPDGTDERRVAGIEAALRPARRASVRTLARLPRPARLLWIFLAVLGVYAVVFHLDGIGLVSLIALPALAAEADFLFQMFRYRSIRFPDAGLATGMFLALLLPPTVPLFQAGAVTAAAITLRHVLRFQERPLLNPAAAGVLVGALFFGMAPSWWGSISTVLVVLLGTVLTLRTPGSWRSPVAFLVSYAWLSVLGNLSFGETTSPQVLLLGALDPAILFFGLFMVSEPRTSLSKPADRWFFGLFVGTATAFLPALFPSLAPLVALLLGNIAAAAVRRRHSADEPVSQPARAAPARRERTRRKGRRSRQPSPPPEPRPQWKVGYRVAAGFLVLVLLGGMAVASNPPRSTPFAAFRPSLPPGSGAGDLTNSCTQDNPTVPSDLLTFLHQRLGPSVILSADANTGTVVFYDPVNRATITETDMYEDFGFAEFNGDDYAAAGCSP